jgi:hypothetical protein
MKKERKEKKKSDMRCCWIFIIYFY